VPLFGVAYKMPCTITGKSYVGVTKGTASQRRKQHIAEAKRNKGKKCSLLSLAILKYGPDAFTVEVLASASTVEDLYELEMLLIKQENTITPYGYNLTLGGNGFCGMTSEMVAKSAASRTQRSPQHAVENHYRRPIEML
jgi:group I intron endonuclease